MDVVTKQKGKGEFTKDHDNDSDGDHSVDDWSEKRIGNLARRVLSMARKKATGAEVAPVAAIAQAPGGVRASNGKEDGGAVDVVTVLADLPTLFQQPPVTQTKNKGIKDRAVTRSANG